MFSQVLYLIFMRYSYYSHFIIHIKDERHIFNHNFFSWLSAWFLECFQLKMPHNLQKISSEKKEELDRQTDRQAGSSFL